MSKNTPEIRINGFEDSWKRDRLFYYADFYSGNGLNWNDVSEDGMQECVLYGNLYTDYGMITDKVTYRTNSTINNPVYSEFGDVLIPASDTTPTGLARATSIEKSGVLLGGDINIVRPKTGIYGSCLSLAINANKKELIKLIKGTTVRHIHNAEIKNIEITMPNSFEEQQNLANYFKEIDKVISFQQQEYEKLLNIKKAMLEKMFPKEGCDVPEIRFKGFDEPWRKHRLVETAKYRNGKAHENCIDENGKYIVVNSKFVSTSGEVRKFSNMPNEPLYKNEIAFVLSDVPNGRAIARTFLVDESGKYTLNQRIAGITPLENTYPYFLHILMNRHPYFLAFDDGAKQTNLTVQDVLDFEASYPEYEEQKKIGEYFAKFDELIMNHQQELEKLKNIKAALLEKMFV